MRPASTMKDITAVTALDRLGGAHQFSTDLCYKGTIENNTLTGSIYCVGGFDPRFNSDDMRAFAESIHKMGVDTIRGKIIADKSMKDDKTYGEGWCWDDDNPTLSPLLISRKDIFLSRFVKRLNDMGIVVEADLDEGIKPGDAFCICHRFHTMDQVLLRMLKESDNLYAEAMFYQLAASSGARSATAKQARAIVMNLVRKLGLNPNSYRFADGSGLSLYNYVTAELEVAMLRYAYKNSNIMLHLKPALHSRHRRHHKVAHAWTLHQRQRACQDGNAHGCQLARRLLHRRQRPPAGLLHHQQRLATHQQRPRLPRQGVHRAVPPQLINRKLQSDYP